MKTADFTGGLMAQNPYPLYERLLKQGPQKIGERWILTQHEHVSALLKAPGYSKQTATVPLASTLRKHILFKDPPEHTRLRAVVTDFFAPASLARQEDSVRHIARQLIKEVMPRRRMEFVGEFATRLPVAVMAEQLGVPDHAHRRLFGLAQSYIFEFSRNPRKSDQAIGELRTYFERHIDGFIANARPGQLIAAIGSAYGKEQLSREEMVELCVILFAAGGETSSCLLGSGLLTLLLHPQALDAVKNDPQLIPDAVEEMLRYETPVPMTTLRVPGEPLVADGLEIPAGQPVIGFLAAANRDPKKFAEPNLFDVHRRPQGHLAFGGGIHYCTGAILARMEARVALESILEALPDIQFDVSRRRSLRSPRAWADRVRGERWHAAYRWRVGTPTRGPQFLDLCW